VLFGAVLREAALRYLYYNGLFSLQFMTEGSSRDFFLAYHVGNAIRYVVGIRFLILDSLRLSDLIHFLNSLGPLWKCLMTNRSSYLQIQRMQNPRGSRGPQHHALSPARITFIPDLNLPCGLTHEAWTP